MAKYCSNCGQELEKGAEFCGKCGTKANGKQESPKQTNVNNVNN